MGKIKKFIFVYMATRRCNKMVRKGLMPRDIADLLIRCAKEMDM